MINCNLQRLDGPVRGNSKVIQELESIFRGAGWNVIKVVWGDDWDRLLAKDTSGLLVKRMTEVVDGQYQKYVCMPGSYIREHFFGKYPELLKLVENYSDERLEKMRRGGHDPEKVFAAYKMATEFNNGKPTVILAKTIKGYGLGEAGEGRNVAHNQKKMNEEELLEFRTRFGIPISDEEVGNAPFYKPAENSLEIKYLKERREQLGGSVPSRPTPIPRWRSLAWTISAKSSSGWKTKKSARRLPWSKPSSHCAATKRSASTSCRSCRTNLAPLAWKACFDNSASTRMPASCTIRSTRIWCSSTRRLRTARSRRGNHRSGFDEFVQCRGTAYSLHGINMIPFYIYYSMFGFQRIGDLIWAAADMRAKGFLIGGTAGRTTLNGEGLQHQDGHSLLNAIAYPTVRAYDPAFAYEVVVIVQEGLRRMYAEGETCIYYLMSENEAYDHPAMPEGCAEGIVKGMYKFRSRDLENAKARVQLFGSGAILNCALAAQDLLAEKYNIASDVWSVTSYTELRREAGDCQRWNMLHPTEEPRQSYLERVLAETEGPYIAASDYVRALAEQLTPFIPGDYFVLGTDGMGRSETRETLRRHFEVDAESITIATLSRLSKSGLFTSAKSPMRSRICNMIPTSPIRTSLDSFNSINSFNQFLWLPKLNFPNWVMASNQAMSWRSLFPSEM